jgi:two-component system NarL family sensor kinase
VSCCRNVVEHADARHAAVTLAADGDQATLVVGDDGTGLPGRVAGPADGHIGLHSQRVRIEAAGGRLDVAATEVGTEATVVVPLAT